MLLIRQLETKGHFVFFVEESFKWMFFVLFFTECTNVEEISLHLARRLLAFDLAVAL